MIRSVYSSRPRRRQRLWLLLAAVIGAAVLGGEGRAQELLLPPQVSPPPLRYVPETLRSQLAAAPDAKARLRLALAQTEEILSRAEQHTAAQQYSPATAQLGVYEALLDDTLAALQQNNRSGGKARDLFKRFEQAVHLQAARIEAMRRTTPTEFSGIMRAAVKHAQATRTLALEAFYGNTVLREEGNGAGDNSKPHADAPRTNAAPPANPPPYFE